jgi:uncharacterized membrane protein YczE
MSKLSEMTLKDAWIDIKSKLTTGRILRYNLGMLLIGIGVSPMVRSNVGVSSWDTLNYSLTSIHSGITFGIASAITSSVIMMVTILLYRNWVYLIMFVPILVVSGWIQVFDQYVFTQMVYEQTWQHILGFTVGMFLLPLGGSLMISTLLPAGVYDEFMLAVLKTVKSSNIALVRAIIEITIVLIALLVGTLTGIGFGKINIGTVIFSLLIGIFISIYLLILERIGLYDRKQIN